MKIHAAAAATLVLLLPALVLAQKTSSDYDKTADFTALKTYALKDGTKVDDPFVDSRINDAIETELKAKGFTKDVVNPDFFVVYHLALDKEKNITSYSTGVGYGPYPYHWGGGFGTTSTNVRVNEILVGTLLIDIVDAKKEALVFRGMGVKEVDPQAKAEKRDRNVSQAVKKVLKDFPPKKKK